MVKDASSRAKEEYNRIARMYEKGKERELVTLIQKPTIVSTLGDISGTRALDLGCGSGWSSRVLKERGVKEVVGLDISEKQIEIAQQKEGELGQGIEYHVRDGFDTDFRAEFGEFDLVTGIFFLHYADTKDKLTKVLTNAHKALRNDGKFVGLIGNPDLENNYEVYGSRATADSDEEGAPVKVELLDSNNNVCASFTAYFWKRATYESIFQSTGFIFEWVPIIFSEEGVRRYGTKFQQDFIKNPGFNALRLRKK